MATQPRPLAVATVAVRLAVEADARRHGLPKPGMASYWKWRAHERGEVAIREAPTRGARRGGEHDG